jgi:acyl-CoA thioesterase-1
MNRRRGLRTFTGLPPLFALLLASLVACGDSGPAPRVAAEAAAEAGDPALVIFLGDSLTAGLGLPEEEAFPALIEASLAAEGFPVRVVNAGVSGDTSAGGVARMEWLLSQGPEVVVVGLGANDGLRGLPLEVTEENLRQIVVRSRAAGAEVVLLGMRIPPSYGFEYAGRFRELYEEVADDLDVPLVPFLLEGVAAKPALNLDDRIHPNARGHEVMAETVYPYVEDAIEEALE